MCVPYEQLKFYLMIITYNFKMFIKKSTCIVLKFATTDLTKL